MKKILFFINTLQGGGAEKVLINLLNSLDREKYEITLVTVSGGRYCDQLPEDIRYKQLVHIRSWFSKQLVKVIYHLPHRWVRRMVSKEEYDIEIAYLEGFPTQVIAAGKGKSTKVAFVHCDISVKPILNEYYRNKRACYEEYAAFDKVCFVSEAAKVGFEKNINKLDNAFVVHNVVNYNEVREKAKEQAEFDFKTDAMKLVCVGRLSTEKAYDRMIRIAAELEKRYVFRIYILGEGDQRTCLESLMNELSVSTVKLLGFKSNPYPYMKHADLLVCSSLFEGYSTVVAESLSLGTPVLTTRCAGMDELLENGKYGIIVDNEESALREGIENILKDKDLYEKIKQSLQNYSDSMGNRSLYEFMKILEDV